MRILMHGINFSPELTGIGRYTGEMAAWLASRGHQVRVVTAPPYYPQWRVAAGWSRLRHRIERPTVAGTGRLTVVRCPLWVPQRPTGIRRVLHLASFVLSSLPAMLAQLGWRPHVVWVVEPALGCAPQALLVARLSGAAAWLHVQDFEVDAAFELGLLRGRTLRAAALGFERWLLRRFDRVSTISARMLQRLDDKGVEPRRRVLLRNWVDVSRVRPAPPPAALRRELGIADGGFVALYSGNMGAKQGLGMLGEVARRLDGVPVCLVLCGDGAARGELQASCAGLANVRFLPLQDEARFRDLLNLADVHLLPQRADAADLVMPSRLTGMLASGRPVVAAASTGTEVATVVADCGLVVDPGDAQAFAAAIERLITDAGLRQRLGQAARDYALRELDRDAILQRFEAQLAGGRTT